MCCLCSQSFDGLEQSLVAVHDDIGKFGWGEAAEDGACGVASYAADADEEEEELALLFGVKAEEDPCVFSYGFVDVEEHFAFPLYGGVGVETYVECVAYSMTLYGGLCWSEFCELSFEVVYHECGSVMVCFLLEVVLWGVL